MDVLGLTFDELRAELKPHPHEVKPLRACYKQLLRGEPAPPPLQADILPVTRRVTEGDLTKFTQQLPDGSEIESVVVPMQRHGREWNTLCVSSQVGCARGCLFCETGQLGFLRNLTPSQITGQVAAARRDFADRIRNVVFMGMGEPLDNFDAVVQALRVLMDRSGFSFAVERLTVSTLGSAEGIRRLAQLGWRRLNVAISLNAPNDEIRSYLMPGTKLDPMLTLREALLEYPLRKCQFFMIEYVLIPGVNDEPAHARQLAEFLAPVPCVVNVIPYNPRRDSPWPAPTEETVVRFLACLHEVGQVCKRRLTKGRTQMAACGQLGNRARLTE